MAYVVTEPCIRCKFTDCAPVRPVSCLHEGPNFLVIDPDECIDCDICVRECPGEAIFPADGAPPEQREFIALNADLARRWLVIDVRREPPADAGKWAEVKNKLAYLDR